MAGHGLRLTDLDDFLLPAQECVKPDVLEKGKEGVHLVVEDGATFEVGEDGSKSKLQEAAISLADCLACSGCITSAESILVSQQSKESFIKQIESGDKHMVVSISPHARASIATWLRMTPSDVQNRLTGVFRNMGVAHVLDLSFAHLIEVHEKCLEFEKKWREKQHLPVLESTCPGWICFAEKTQENILPYISTSKSAQQIAGSFIKSFLCKSLGKKREDIYHVSIAPCHDKKLEATRPEFQDANGCRDVDIVITAGELQNLLLEKEIDLRAIPPCAPDETIPEYMVESDITPTSDWGGNLEPILSHMAAVLSASMSNIRLEKKTGRNNDICDYLLYSGDECLLHFATYYGFRNIQNLVRKFKRNSNSSFDYVEVMACPGACLNGGGQVPPSRTERPRDLLLRVTETFNSEGMEVVDSKYRRSELPSELNRIREEWLEGHISTEYHGIPKTEDVNPAFIRW